MGRETATQVQKAQRVPYRINPRRKTTRHILIKQTMMNNRINEMKNTLEGINSRITEAEERISDLEDRMVKFTAAEQKKEKRLKTNEDSLRDLWDNIKRNNICIIGVPEGEEREKGPEKIFEEIIIENFPNMGKERATQVQEAQRDRKSTRLNSSH